MGRLQERVAHKVQQAQLLSFFRGRGLAWLRQQQYCLGMDYILRALNLKPTCCANLLLAKAAGTVLGEQELVAKCDDALLRKYARHGVSSPEELVGSHSRLSDQQKIDVLLVLDASQKVASNPQPDGAGASYIESYVVKERQQQVDEVRSPADSSGVQRIVDDAIVAAQGSFNDATKRVLMLEPSGSTFGRGLFADKRIPQGSVILSDTMLVGRRMRGDSCAHCLVSLSRHGASVRCDHCEEAYCSTSCRDAAWRGYHQCACKSSNPLYAEWEARMEALLQGEAPTSHGAEEAGTDAKAALNCLVVGKLLCMATMTQLHPLEQPGVSHLRGFVEFEARSCLANIGAMAVTLSEALRQPNLFVEEVLSLLAIVQTNEFLVSQGMCIYPVLSLLNHSCSPNCVAVGPNLRQQQVVATKDIRAGEQLMIDYNPRLTGSLTYEQRRHLFQQRNFECFCSRCILKK